MNYFKCFLILIFVLNTHAVFSQNIEKTSIMVLASPHLRTVEGDNLEKSLKPINHRIIKFHPDAVCLEFMSPRLIETLLKDENPGAKKILDYFARNIVKTGRMMQARLQRSSIKSTDLSDSLLNLSGTMNDHERQELINNLIAGYNYYSAMLQLMYLDKKFIRDHNLEKDSVYSVLFAGMSQNDEIIKIGLTAAFNLKLTNVYGIDNHTDDYRLMDFPESFTDDLQNSALYKNFDKAYYDNLSAALKKQVLSGNLTAIYEYYNSTEYQINDIEKQWSLFLNNNLKSGLDRSRYSLWEQRNMIISSDIMRVASLFPRKNILVVIGASHKQFLDKYLQNAADISIKNLRDIN